MLQKPKNDSFYIIFLVIISSLFLLLSYVPNMYESYVADLLPNNRVMVWGEHIYTYDYNVYLSKIKQGQEGRWKVIDKYDNHPEQKGVFLQMLYLLAGKVGGIFKLGPVLTFHLLRTILSFVWIITIILLNVYFLKRPLLYITGTIFSLIASSFPIFYQFEGRLWAGMYMGWWQEMDVLKRISYIPHYIVNYVSIAILAYLLYLFSKTYRRSYFVLICAVEFLLFFIHPSGALLFLFSWFVYHLLKTVWFRQYSRKNILLIFLYSLILVLVSAIPVLYIQKVTSVYPWRSLVDFDRQFTMPFKFVEYILALGPVFITGFAGAIIALYKKEERLLPMITWILGSFSGMVLMVFMKNFQSPARFVQTANHIPLAILSVYLVYILIQKYKKIGWLFYGIVFISIFSTGVIQVYYSIKSQVHFIHQKAVAVLPLVPYPSQVMYPLTDFYYAVEWLKQNTATADIALSKITAGNYIPAYSGNFVYYGHIPESPHYNQRLNMVNWFFSGTATTKEARNFLKNEKISYIFYGPQEKEGAVVDINAYSFLKPVYKSEYVTIYKVQ